ncbi:MAG TPA: hypothetical protein VGO81_18275 [Solirubrobacteraceae bacterium]|jgi:hypothetical protein|nr:hypothetical protein [Solirubrobacteraceae bacterium]
MDIADTIQAKVGRVLAPAATASQPYLAIYMNDQLALGVLWREIARRSARENAGTDAGAALDRVATAIAEDVGTFEQIMARVEIPKTHAKPLLAMAGERVGRLKLNGRLTGYSPLSRFEELDFLLMGIDGKVVLWTNLRDHARLGDRLPDVDFDGLIQRARQQRALLEPFHAEAGREALGGGAA